MSTPTMQEIYTSDQYKAAVEKQTQELHSAALAREASAKSSGGGMHTSLPMGSRGRYVPSSMGSRTYTPKKSTSTSTKESKPTPAATMREIYTSDQYKTAVEKQSQELHSAAQSRKASAGRGETISPMTSSERHMQERFGITPQRFIEEREKVLAEKTVKSTMRIPVAASTIPQAPVTSPGQTGFGINSQSFITPSLQREIEASVSSQSSTAYKVYSPGQEDFGVKASTPAPKPKPKPKSTPAATMQEIYTSKQYKAAVEKQTQELHSAALAREAAKAAPKPKPISVTKKPEPTPISSVPGKLNEYTLETQRGSKKFLAISEEQAKREAKRYG